MTRLAAAMIVATLVAGGALDHARAGAPTDQVKSGTDQVLKIIQDPALKGADKTPVRRQQLRTVADQVFDWQETGKRALGRH